MKFGKKKSEQQEMAVTTKVKPKMAKKTKVIISGACAAALVISGAGVYGYQNANAQNVQTVYKETTVSKGNLTVGVTESGSVTIGTLTQDVDMDDISTSSSSSSTSSAMGMSAGSSNSSNSSSVTLEVEEVYVTVGQTVNAGDALLKISDDSISDYRSELKEAVSTASASLSEAKLSSAKQQLSASYSYSSSVASGSVAEANYNATIQNLQDAVDDAQEAFDEQASVLWYYYDLYYNDGDDDYEDEYEEAQETYDSLSKKLTQAKNNYTTKSIEAKKTYETAMLNYNNADAQYTVDVNGIDSDVSDAQDTLSDAQDALTAFNTFVGDGTIYAEYSGTITAVGYTEGDTLSSSTSVVTFADASSVTMTVSVSQEDISEIAIGDTVNINLTAYEEETFAGTVSSMDTSTSSGSSTVSYNVTVVFTGDISKVYADMTGNVTFIQKEVEDVLYVSNKAIINEGTASYVNVKDASGTVTKVEVITGFSDGVNVEIQSGLEEGETVLIESQVVSE